MITMEKGGKKKINISIVPLLSENHIFSVEPILEVLVWTSYIFANTLIPLVSSIILLQATSYSSLLSL